MMQYIILVVRPAVPGTRAVPSGTRYRSASGTRYRPIRSGAGTALAVDPGYSRTIVRAAHESVKDRPVSLTLSYITDEPRGDSLRMTLQNVDDMLETVR